MKPLFFIAGLISATFCYAQGDVYSVRGKAGNVKENTKVFLHFRKEGNNQVDSTYVRNNQFTFKGNTSEPFRAYISINYDNSASEKSPDYLEFYIEKGEILLNSADSIKNAVISNSPLNDDVKKWREVSKPLSDAKAELRNFYLATPEEERKSDEFMEKYYAKYNSISASEKESALNFIRQYPGSYFCMDQLFTTCIGYYPDGKEAESLYVLFTPELRNTSLGKSYEEKIERWKKTSIGVVAPEFTQNDPDGNPVNLSDFRGKYVLIDFWASWCGPCRKENPSVVKAYQTFKDKGFTVLGISLDNGKRNGREAWLKAIEDDKLTWTNVSDLNFWGNEVAVTYGINSIPANFLLDPNGKIIGRNLRGKDLIDKLEEFIK